VGALQQKKQNTDFSADVGTTHYINSQKMSISIIVLIPQVLAKELELIEATLTRKN
jgi:hypothetical protein